MKKIKMTVNVLIMLSFEYQRKITIEPSYIYQYFMCFIDHMQKCLQAVKMQM